jgi:predicted RNA-binding Zn-ribbon protein involved in translation (DUF1610 family)
MSTDQLAMAANSDSEEQEFKCPGCSGGDFRYGRSGVFKVPFVPDTPILKFARSYMPRQFVCLDCGFMGFALKEADLVKLRQEKQPE